LIAIVKKEEKLMKGSDRSEKVEIDRLRKEEKLMKESDRYAEVEIDR
jgi:hypothetical protein